ncbi:nucleotide exchange factor GrpE [Planctomonas psychrotolerans]|uniref:nucleotide exchange factor GrpE n=1 Tax=Planctomonas psychrotolerans TaxID=2528712 RepID=UPI00123894CA|nr:nucleotide exchange factor GrpE [Planctomonas psychrotolerans]
MATDKSNNDEFADGRAEDGSGAAAADPSTGQPVEDAAFIEAEGPDVETSSTELDEELEDLLNAEAAAPSEPAAQQNEHLVDLKRVTAEYANYRKRTEANRELDRSRAIGDVAKMLLPVLDDLDRAEKHGDLAEGTAFSAIAQKLRSSIAALGLAPVGAVGDPFDPTLHDAIFQKHNPEVTVATVADVVESGYFVGDSLLRAAKVVVDTPDNG